MDFAPYQSESPELARTKSPPLNTHRPYSPPVAARSPPPQQSLLPIHQPTPWRTDRDTVNQFETSLPIRLDWEAVMAYVLLPPAGGVFLLITEHKSDYVRFHAWQSALLFSFMVVVHLIFSFSSFLSYTLLVCDLVGIGYLSHRAYRDADTLDRCEVPFFGPLASSILDDE